MYVDVTNSDRKKINSVSNSKSGSAILIDDISPVTHEMSVKISSDTVEDLTAVKVSRCGKNLLPYPYVETTLARNGITFTDNGDGTITANGTATADTQFRLQDTVIYPDNYNPFKYLIGKVVGINGSPDGSSKDTYAIQSITTGSYGNTSFTISNSKRYRFAIFIKSGITVSNLVFKPMIYLSGVTNYDYEFYNRTDYTPNADGTVNGVTSLYPNTTLMTDTEGVIIDCEYLTKNYKYVLDNRIPKQTQVDWQQNDETANDYVKNRPGGYIDNDTIVKIPEKYLDIKNTNIVNGSTVGSLRTIGSKEEDSSYKLGKYAMAEGLSTIASSECQHVQGKFNIEDANGEYLDIIGNGTASKRSNAATIDKNGNAWFLGDVYTGSNSGTHKDSGSRKLATEKYVDDSKNDRVVIKGNGVNSIKHNGAGSIANGDYSIALGSVTKALKPHSVTIGFESSSHANDGVVLGRMNNCYSMCGATLGYGNIAGDKNYKDNTS